MSAVPLASNDDQEELHRPNWRGRAAREAFFAADDADYPDYLDGRKRVDILQLRVILIECGQSGMFPLYPIHLGLYQGRAAGSGSFVASSFSPRRSSLQSWYGKE
jgi:hypothetical protein